MTIKSYISAIRAVLMEDGYELNEDSFLLGSLTRACKIHHDHISTKLPIKKMGDLFESQPYLLCLFRTMLLITYYGLFRVCEVAKTSSNHAVKAMDAHIARNKDKIMFVLHTLKTHDKGCKPQIVKIAADAKSNNNRYCPFSNIKKYLCIRDKRLSDDEQFFIFRDGSPVTAIQFGAVLKKTIKAAGIDNKLYTCHSLRSGRASGLLQYGVLVEVIKRLGRWKSNAVYKYLR